MDAIQSTRLAALSPLEQLTKSPNAESGSFKELLADGMNRIFELEKAADTEVRKLMSGEPVELHRVVMAGEEAGLAFELMIAIRNKSVDAYQEIMRMPV